MLSAARSDTPINCGGVTVHPGDAVLADESGVLFMPANEAEAAADCGRRPPTAGVR